MSFATVVSLGKYIHLESSCVGGTQLNICRAQGETCSNARGGTGPEARANDVRPFPPCICV